MIGLRPIATIYTPNEDDGDYTVLQESEVKCRLLATPSLTPEGGGREEQVMKKRVLFDPLVTVPNDCQLRIAGERWNVVPNTIEAITGTDGVTVVYRRCDVVFANRQADT